MALNLAEALRAQGAQVVLWTPLPLPPGIPWWKRMQWMRRRIAEYVQQEGPFDFVDVPPVAVSAALARRCMVVVRSVQPELLYLWTEAAHAGAVGRVRFTHRVAGALLALYHALLVVGGWQRATCILCLGSGEFQWMRRWFPWWRKKLRVYVNAINDDERAQLLRIRGQRRPPSGEGTRFLWLGRWAAH